MTEITFIGTGLMGAGLATSALGAGKACTVWNRTTDKTQPLVDAGAAGADNLLDAIAASSVVLVCVDNYAVTRKIFQQEGAMNALSSKILVQMSTGTPGNATETDKWFSGQGVRYIDGAVLGGPDSIREDHGRVIFAGPEDAYLEAEPVLTSLATNAQYVGHNIRAASALDLAWLCRHYGMFASVAHGAAICNSESVGLDHYANVFPDTDYAHHFVMNMHRDELENPTATLRTWASAFDQVLEQASDAGLEGEFPDLMKTLFDRALEAGYGDLDIAALAKITK